MRFAQRNHATAAMPNDDLTVPRRSPPPQREAQVAHKSQALRVREGSTEPVLVLHDPTPQADRPKDRRVAGPPERVGARDGMEAARAMELGSDVRSVAGAGGCGPSGRPGLAVAGDRSEPNIRSVPRAHQGPRSPGLDRFDQSRDRGLEPDGCHRLSGRIGFGTSGLGGRRFEVGNLVGQGSDTGSTSMIRWGRPMSMGALLARSSNRVPVPSVLPRSDVWPAPPKPQTRTSLLIPLKSLKKIRPRVRSRMKACSLHGCTPPSGPRSRHAGR